MWLRDHFHFLVEVVVRLSAGIEKKEATKESEEDDYDK
jgi:hypothetical protein